MEKKRYFLVFLASLFVALFTVNSFAAYTCTSSKKYTSCVAGRHLSNTSAGNSCVTCPSNSSSSAGNTNVWCKCNTGYESLHEGEGGRVSHGDEPGTDEYCKAMVVKVTLNNQSATTAGTTEYYYHYKNKGKCYYYTSSALTTCIAGTDGINITKPTRTGYTFGGYYTSTNGSGTQYIDATGKTVGDLYLKQASNITLYAKWTANTYTVNYNVNGGSGTTPASTTCTYGQNCTLNSGSGLSKTQHTLAGWSTSSTAQYGDFSVRNLATSGSVTVYAVWQPKIYHLIANYPELGINGSGSSYSSDTIERLSEVYGKHFNFCTHMICDSSVYYQNSTLPSTTYSKIKRPSVTTNEITTSFEFDGFWSTNNRAYIGRLPSTVMPASTQYINAAGKILISPTSITSDRNMYTRWKMTCPKGSYLPTYSETCTTCPVGYYCPGGTYSITGDILGAGRTACPANSTTSGTGNSARTACICNAGFSGDARTGSCTACAKGYYKPSAENTLCTQASTGYYVDGTGQSSQKSCTSYRANTTTTGRGSTSASDCLCVAGTYYYIQSTTGTQLSIPECRVCSSGYKTTISNATSCTGCTSGYATSGTAVKNHDEQADCKRTITLNKNGGTGNTYNGILGTTSGSITCYEGVECNFYEVGEGKTNNITWTNNYNKAIGGWGTTSTCHSITYKFTNPSASTYYACKTYLVQFNLNGTTGTKPNSVYATYGVAMPTLSTTTAPTRTGYTFGGWWDTSASTGGMQYYTTAGESARSWNKDSAPTTLYARWNSGVYEISLYKANFSAVTDGRPTYNMDRSIYEKYATGWYSNSSATTAITSITPPTNSEHTFLGYYEDAEYVTKNANLGTPVISRTGTLPANTTFTADTTLGEVWAKNCIQPSHGTCNMSVSDAGVVTYTATCETGYTLSGNGTYNPTCTGIASRITFDLNDADSGTAPTAVTATYGSAMPRLNAFVKPEKEFFTFRGWYDAKTGGTQYYNANGISARTWNKTTDTVLYAQFTQNKVTCEAGKMYDGTDMIKCPSGKYCPGTGQVNEGEDGCFVECNTHGAQYTHSAPGSTALTGCYADCDAPCAEPVACPDNALECMFDTDHTIIGRYYYTGNGKGTCSTFHIVATELLCPVSTLKCAARYYTNGQVCGACADLKDNDGNSKWPQSLKTNNDSPTKCYSTCYKACDQQPCPEHAESCEHGTERKAGGVYYDPKNLASDYCQAASISCSISVTCEPGYVYNASQNSCDAATFAVALKRNYNAGDETVAATIYEKYDNGWYSDADATTALSKAPVPTRDNYHFRGYYDARTGGIQVIDSAGNILVNDTSFTADATLYARWEAALFTCSAGMDYQGNQCPNGHYCPGGTVTAGTESDENGGCQPVCPASTNGGIIGSSKNATDISQCYSTRANQTFSEKKGYGSETCYWQQNPAGYTAECSISIESCMAGYWREQINSTICVNVGFGAYSPDRDAEKHMCDDLSGADATTTTAGQNSAVATLCYTPCPNKTVDNGTHKPVNEKEFFNGTIIPQCQYTSDTLVCDTGYQANGEQCENRVYAITLDPDFTGGTTSTIYLKYNDGWYSNINATDKITKVTLPTKPGGYTCYGYDYNGEKIIDASGTLPTNYKMFTSDVTIVATYEQNPEITCAAGKYYKDSARACEQCPVGSYCPGVTTYEGIGSDRGLNSCAAENGTYTAAKDAAGMALNVTVSTKAGSDNASQCFATNVEYVSATSQGAGSQTCYLNTSTKEYSAKCETQKILTCAKGYWLAKSTDTDCSEVGNGYYSADKQTERTACPAKSSNPNVTTNGTTSDNVQQCYLGNIWLEPGASDGAAHGGVRRSCYHTATVANANSEAGYTYNCDKSVIVTCNAGYWLADKADKDCSPVGNNYYSPAQSAFTSSGEVLKPDQNNPGSSILRTACPDAGLTNTDTASAQTQCYKNCAATITIANGTGVWDNNPVFNNGTAYDSCKYTAQCNENYRPTSSSASANPRCVWDDPTECPVGFYCPEGEDPVECPADKDGIRGTTDKGATEVTQCFVEYPEYKATPNYPNRKFENGTGSATCWFQGAATTGDYTECRNVQATACNAGFWYRERGSYLCTDVDNGYYSPAPNINQTECPTGWAGSIKPADSVQKCYKNCRKDVAHASSVTPASETVNATGPDQYAECLFGVVCDTGYTVVQNNTANPTCQPNTYTVTLNKNGATGETPASIQCTFDSGACGLPATDALSRAGYTTQRKWCTAADGTGTCYTAGMSVTENISATGTAVTLYAIWTPNVYEITLNDNGATSAATPRTVYLKYATGWFVEQAAVTPISALTRVPARDRYEFTGYVSGTKTVINSEGKMMTDDAALTFTTENATISAKWAAGTTECAAGTYYAGEELSCQPCAENHYCPGGRFATDGGVDGMSECPDGGTAPAGSQSAAACFKTVDFAPAHGRGTQVCYYNEGERLYKDRCRDQNIATCEGGYWLDSTMWQAADKSDMDCVQAEIGYYSPADDTQQHECPGPDGNRGTTDAKGAVNMSQCFRDGETYTATYGAGIQRCSYTSGTGNAAEYKTNCRNAEIKTCWAGYWLANASDTDCSEVGLNFYSETDDIQRQACPEKGITGSTTTATSAAACYKSSLEYVAEHGGGDQLCYWDPEHRQYSVSCGQRTLTYCHAGYYVNLGVNALDCIEVGYGHYSPRPDTKRQACPAGETTATKTSGSASDCIACPAGEICTPDVRQTCTTATNGTHPNSDAGTTDVAMCWRECAAVPNAAAMTGRDYYGAPDTCAVARCESGFTLENGACTKCPAGYFCGPNPDCTGDACDDKKSCATLGDGSWNMSDAGADDAKSCYRTCEPYDIEGGKAVPKSEKAFWPNKCEYKGISDEGNPCDIVDGACVVTSCKPSFEMKNGRCVACNREHALGYKTTGNCLVDKCEAGWHPYGQSCESDKTECTAPNALRAEKQWDYKKNAYGICLIKECEDGYHISSNACVRDVQECVVEHGAGEKEWNHTTNTWGPCVATSCDPGFTSDPSETNEPTKQCGACKNKFGVKGELAASSYSRGCTISACMYQGEMYNLEGNECKPICSVDGYSDETGTMKWNPATKKCERTCKEGYIMW